MRALGRASFGFLVGLLLVALVVQHLVAPTPGDTMKVYRAFCARTKAALPEQIGDWSKLPKPRQLERAPGRDVNASYERPDGFVADVIISTRSVKQESCFINAGTEVLRGPETHLVKTASGKKLKCKLLIVHSRSGGPPVVVLFTYLDSRGRTGTSWWIALAKKKLGQILTGRVGNVFLRVASAPVSPEMPLKVPLAADEDLLKRLAPWLQSQLEQK